MHEMIAYINSVLYIYILSLPDATALTRSYFGSGTGPYHLSGLSCSGEERTLLECSYYGSSTGYMYHTCGAGRDAGVRCDGKIIYTAPLFCLTHRS